MDYTKNHHLPQWVRSDRILMEDFNDAMANIEKGFVSVDSRLSDSDSASAQAEARTWDALLRSGRNCLAERLERFDRSGIYSRNGLLFNPLTSAEMAETLTGNTWREEMGVYAGQGAPYPDDIMRYWNPRINFALIGGSITHDDAISYCEFTAPIDGVIKSFNLYLHMYLGPNFPETNIDLGFTAHNLSTGELLDELEVHLNRAGTDTLREEVPLAVHIPIIQGKKYRLQFIPLKPAAAVGRYGFLMSAYQPEYFPDSVEYNKFTIYNPPAPSVSHTRTFSSDGPASHAVAVVRYRKAQDAPRLSVSLNGKQMALASDQPGENCREAWYTASDSYQGNVPVRIDLSAGEREDIQLLEYAVMLL